MAARSMRTAAAIGMTRERDFCVACNDCVAAVAAGAAASVCSGVIERASLPARSSSSRNSSAVAKRSAGTRAIAFPMIASAAGETVGRICEAAAAFPPARAKERPAPSALERRLAGRISYSTQPSE